jgi:hypothetical protein
VPSEGDPIPLAVRRTPTCAIADLAALEAHIANFGVGQHARGAHPLQPFRRAFSSDAPGNDSATCASHSATPGVATTLERELMRLEKSERDGPKSRNADNDAS